MSLWSRDMIRLRSNKFGSAMNSHQTVVNTTIDGLVKRMEGENVYELTCGGKLRVDSFTHDALQTHSSAHETETHKTQSVGPCWVASIVRDATLTALPYSDGGSHGKQCLDHCP